MRALLAPICAAAALAWTGAAGATTTTVVDVPTPRGATQRFLHVRPEAPVATIVAVPGGSGIFNIKDDGSMSGAVAQCSPVARNLSALAGRGFAVALVDQTSDGRVRRFADVQEVFSYVRARDAVPAWVIGGSASTQLAGELAVNLPAGDPLGVIFAPPETLDPALAAQIVRPTQLVFHPNDAFQRSGVVFSALTAAPIKERTALTGGSDDGCGFHLFNGLDAEFVAAIADFINRHNGSFPPSGTANYNGIWWKSPAGSESGWGINFAHQGDTIFATWFTYDAAGKAWWVTMTATRTAAGTYTGDIYQYRGPALGAVPFSPSAVVSTKVGTGSLTFTDVDDGSFAYTVNGVTQTKAITKTVFATVPTCTFGANLAAANNYQDIWWAAPAGSESGWGVNFTHQGDTIFVTWFTYDVDGTPLWLQAVAQKTAAGFYSGTLYRNAGPPFSAVPFVPANVTQTAVGTLTITFANGNGASYAYTVTLGAGPAVTQAKSVVRTVFVEPGTACH